MAIDIDDLAVLRAIVENPVAFQDVTAEINEVGRTLVLKQLKSKTTLERLRLIHHALGGEALALILDTPSATLAKKLDKDNPGSRPRRRIGAVSESPISRAAAPSRSRSPPVAPKKEPKGKKPARSPEQKALGTARQIWQRHASFGGKLANQASCSFSTT